MNTDKPVQQWEYVIHPSDPIDFDNEKRMVETMNLEGSQGWELVAVVALHSSTHFHVFKRPKTPDQ
jgi:hypothetical protein